jgi:sphingomyelin phosphodiesterase
MLLPLSLAALALITAARADLLSDIVTALENAVDCAGCSAALVPIQTLAHLGNEDFVSVFTSICELVGVRISSFVSSCSR